jgi:large subunit ribosomal protein L6
MSRLGKTPIPLPKEASIEIKGQELTIKGAKGTVNHTLPSYLSAEQVGEGDDGFVQLHRADETKKTKTMHGLHRSLVNNIIIGVTQGYEKTLTLRGTGYRVEPQGTKLVFQVGFGHPVEFQVPEGVEFELPKAAKREETDIIVRGIDKQQVGETAARIRRIRPPDLYIGKGIRYKGENVRQLEGKAFGS